MFGHLPISNVKGEKHDSSLFDEEAQASGEDSGDELDDEGELGDDFIVHESKTSEKRKEKRRRDASEEDSLEVGLDHDLMSDEDEERPTKRAKRLTRLKKKKRQEPPKEETQGSKLANELFGEEDGIAGDTFSDPFQTSVFQERKKRRSPLRKFTSLTRTCLMKKEWVILL